MNRLTFSLCLLLAGVLIGLAELPYQWLSELGFRLQRLWPLGGDGALEPLLVTAPALATLLFVLLAWGPLAAGRGCGLTGVLALQTARNDAERERALAPLSLRHQLARLPLLALTHLAGLSVGTESPAAALGAALLLALRRRLAPLQQLPLALTAAIGGGAGLGAAFRSPLLGAAYALEELSAVAGFSLVAPTLVLAGIGTLFTTTLGQPARLAEGMAVALAPELLPLAAVHAAGGGEWGHQPQRWVARARPGPGRHARRPLVGAVAAVAGAPAEHRDRCTRRPDARLDEPGGGAGGALVAAVAGGAAGGTGRGRCRRRVQWRLPHPAVLRPVRVHAAGQCRRAALAAHLLSDRRRHRPLARRHQLERSTDRSL
jgi:H+/Cl- antiporter ClcA